MRYAIATPHAAATEAGAAAFRAGGGAIDAALAAATVLTVVYPHMCAIGGDAMALAASPDGEVTALIGAGAAPAGLTVDAEAMPWDGPLTITVPGMVDAWGALAGVGARRPWRAHFERAVSLARAGVPRAPHLARAIDAQRDGLARDPGMRAVMLADGPLVQPALAGTLERIAARGPRELYEGETAAALAAGLQAAGSPLAEDDLRAHATEVTRPLRGAVDGLEVLTTPPPTQGFALLRILELLEAAGDGADPAAAFRAAAAERDAALADPRGPSGDTVAIVAADSSGAAVSLIQSVYGSFGSGILEPATGAVCHNRGAAFSLDPASPNRLRPGRRPAHTLMPVLVQEAGRVRMALGTMGARAQPQIIAQVLLRLLAGAAPQQAVAAPRIVVEGDLVTRDDAAVGHAMAIDGLEAGADPRSDGAAASGVTAAAGG